MKTPPLEDRIPSQIFLLWNKRSQIKGTKGQISYLFHEARSREFLLQRQRSSVQYLVSVKEIFLEGVMMPNSVNMSTLTFNREDGVPEILFIYYSSTTPIKNIWGDLYKVREG